MQDSDLDSNGGFTWEPPAPIPASMPTGPITDPNDPRLNNPAYANDPNVIAYQASQTGRTARNDPGGTGTGTQGGSTEPPAPQATQTGTTAPPLPGGGDSIGMPAAAPTAAGAGPGSLTQPFTGVYVPAGSASPNPAPLPTIDQSVATVPGAPAFPTIPQFAQPTMAEAMADPGYQFTLQQGNNNLQNWAAARGTLNDSSTAKALIDYGQGAATTQYGNVWNRDLQAYDENVGTQYLQPFQAAYQNWMSGTVNPTMANYTTTAANVAHLNDVSWEDNWNAFLQSYNQFKDQRDSTFDKQFQVATA